ncbi:MAG: dTMP kinase [Mycobacteriales bacterium]
MRAVIRIAPFRRLWLVLGLSSFGDWLGLLATSLFAAAQVTGSTAQGAAFGGVIVVRLLPALFLGPLAGVFADRFDRRITMALCDFLRFLLFASIPTVALLADSAAIAVTWALAATFLTEMVGMFWIPAKEASVPNLVPRQRLEAANQLSLITTFGVTPVLAALVIAVLSRGMLLLVDDDPSRLWIQPVDLALYINAVTFFAAALVVLAFIPQLSGRGNDAPASAQRAPGLLRALTDGWNFVRRTPMVRGLVYGILGAFAAGGTVIGVAKFYAASLSGGDAAFGLLFGAIFIGLGLGMAAGPALVRELSRRRWFGISIVFAGVSVSLLAIAPHLAVAVPLVLCVGIGAGMAYLSGMTLLGVEVADALRGRIFAFVQSMVRVVLLVAIAGASLLVGLGGSRVLELGSVEFSISAARVLLVAGGLLGIGTGVLAFRRMDDKPGVPVLADLWGCIRGRPIPIPASEPGGMFIVFEGGEGAGKSVQTQRLVQWLSGAGRRCSVTRQPGGTQLGGQIRWLLLDASTDTPTPRTEALLYAADRAQHVETVIRPELRNGGIVVCDRYVDSSLAYQGGGRGLPQVEVAWLSDWASHTLKPDLVVLLDIEPEQGLARVAARGESDRIEGQTLAFHRRVRQVFLDRAAADPSRYLIVDAAGEIDQIAERIRSKVRAMLPETLRDRVVTSAGDSEPAVTGSSPEPVGGEDQLVANPRQ